MKNTQLMQIVIPLLIVSCSSDDSGNTPPEPTPTEYGIYEFISVTPAVQNTDFVIPSSHEFQKIIESGDPLTGGGTMPIRNDFTGYVPINGSSTQGYLSINSEHIPGGVTVLDIQLNQNTQLWETTSSIGVDFSSVGGTARNCSGAVTPWNTILSCEETINRQDANGDGYYDLGWTVEIDPATKTVIDKRWALGNFAHENAVVHQNLRTVYQGADSNPGYLFKFVADQARDLSSGALYVYKGEKEGAGNWLPLNNSSAEERNTTLTQCQDLGATVFNGIEDVEIGPDGLVYFAVKGEDSVYRFEDQDALSGTDVSMTRYVGQMDYSIDHPAGQSTIAWGTGNDNLAFDDEGNLWVLQDGGNNYIWVVGPGHTQAIPDVRVFGIAPLGSEPTGITFSPDYKYLFISIQSPDPANSSTQQLDAAGDLLGFDNHISLVISRKEYLGTD